MMAAENHLLHLITTEDGSHTLLHAALNETYHSRHGAMRESQHVFIENGLLHVSEKFESLNILEIGFGTGLNAWLTQKFGAEQNLKICYTTLETLPLPPSIFEQLNYTNSKKDREIFLQLHHAEWNSWFHLNSFFSLLKWVKRLQDFTTSEKYHCIYYDAFAPLVQPEMWNKELFHKLFEMLQPEGVLVTYCAKGQVRRDMQDSGFFVERLKGPPGKREMLRASKSSV